MRCGDLFSAQQHKTKIMEWTETKNEKPKEDLLVIIFDGEIKMGRFDGTFWLECNSSYLNHNVSHWMYLPNSPKVGCDHGEGGCVCDK